MDDRRQKIQLELAWGEEAKGEAPKLFSPGTESLTAKRGTESPALIESLMVEVCERENCKQALKRVKANKGSPGVDGMTVQQLPGFLQQHWPAIREQLLSGTYKPQPVRRKEIDKPDGSGVRKLGIPTVLDRFIQQAVLQVLQKRWDRAFLTAGVMEGGLVSPVDEGTPQGGPLSPLLSNLVLDEFDRELERRGHCFAR